MKTLKCIKCNKEISYNSFHYGSKKCKSCSHLDYKPTEEHCKNLSKALKGHKVSEETKQKKSKSMKKYYKDPKAREKTSKSLIIPGLNRNYPLEFKVLKPIIRNRDNNICQNPECNKTQLENERLLDVHHIDYDKFNLNKDNLITLCKSCHMKSNYNRDYWQNFYKNIIKEKEYVKQSN